MPGYNRNVKRAEAEGQYGNLETNLHTPYARLGTVHH